MRSLRDNALKVPISRCAIICTRNFSTACRTRQKFTETAPGLLWCPLDASTEPALLVCCHAAERCSVWAILALSTDTRPRGLWLGSELVTRRVVLLSHQSTIAWTANKYVNIRNFGFPTMLFERRYLCVDCFSFSCTTDYRLCTRCGEIPITSLKFNFGPH